MEIVSLLFCRDLWSKIEENNRLKGDYQLFVNKHNSGLTRVEAFHPKGQSRLGDGNEFQSDVELAPPKVTQPSGSTELCDLNPHTRTRSNSYKHCIHPKL